MLSSRFECKYLIDDGRVQSITDWIRPYVRPDRHALHLPRHRYAISSLYLDSSDLHLFATTVEGIKNRFKLRIRTYGDAAQDPVFLEIKKRMNGIVYKRRTKLERTRALRFLRDLALPLARKPVSRASALHEFHLLTEQIRARPVMRVKYQRQAYESAGGDPVRITFDSELTSALTFDIDLLHNGRGWVRTPLAGTILEIKFTERFPAWVGELIERFDLQRCSVPKYVLSLEKAIRDGRCHCPIRTGPSWQPQRRSI